MTGSCKLFVSTYSSASPALELKQYNITVNAYAPGIIQTDIRKCCQLDVMILCLFNFSKLPGATRGNFTSGRESKLLLHHRGWHSLE